MSDMPRSTRQITITLDSALSPMEWSAFVAEIRETALQAACDFAARCVDDDYQCDVKARLVSMDPED